MNHEKLQPGSAVAASVQAYAGRTAMSRALNVYDVIAAIVFVTALCTYLLTAATVESFGSDTSTYYGLAESLRSEHRYWFNFEPHTTYPPGFPVLLAGLMALGGDSFAVLVKLSIVTYFIGLAGTYLLVRMQRGARTALAVIALLVTSYVFYFWSTVGLHSEAAYFTAEIYALISVHVAESTQKRWLRLLGHVGVAAFGSYLLLVRSIGVTFVTGLLLWMAVPIGQRRPRWTFSSRLKRWGPTIAAPILVLCGWTFWAGANKPREHTDYMQSYVQQLLKEDPHQIDSPNVSLVRLPSRTWRMLGIRIENARRTVLNIRSLPLGWKNPISLVLFATIAVGFVTSLLREGSAVDWYVLSYAGMLLLWPFDEGTRFLHPIQPFLIVYGIDGWHRLSGWIKAWGPLGAEAWLRSAAIGLLAIVAATGVYQISTLATANVTPDPRRFTNAATVEAARWVAANTQVDAVIMNDEPAILHRLTGRKTIRFPLNTDPHVLRDSIDSGGVDFIVVLNERQNEYFNPSTMQRFDKLKALYPRSFAPVHIFPRGTIYSVEANTVNRQ